MHNLLKEFSSLSTEDKCLLLEKLAVDYPMLYVYSGLNKNVRAYYCGPLHGLDKERMGVKNEKV